MREVATSPAATRYMVLMRALLDWRKTHAEDTPEEDAMLDEMDSLWWTMSEKERNDVEFATKKLVAHS